ncbi:DNA recombination and repair protein RecO [Lachnospiraceae bacterium KM106-2]|nr:DNA recombination and repair protein RecO [Lachnospiraceae bacterium KM106-2]
MTVTGMVLAAMPVGDFDKRLVILTKEHGKIVAFARGARKPNSALLACSQPFSFGEFQVYAGRNSYSVNSANIQNYFPELREDLDAISYAFYFAELAEYVTRENNDEVEVLKLLYQTFRILTKGIISLRLIRYIFELKLMCINGETPQVFECVSCGSTEDVYLFSAIKGGLVCKQCKKGLPDLISLSGSTIYTLQFIIVTPVEKLYTFTVKDDVLRELGKVLRDYMKEYLNGHFKSLEVLEMIEK